MIDKLSKKLYEKIIELLEQGFAIKEIKEILLEEFGKFNKSVQEYIENEIFKELDTIPPEIMVGVKLSETLYANAKDAVTISSRLIKEHIKSKSTIKELSKKLYEGYGFRDKEVLEVKKGLPKYLLKELNKQNVQKKLLKKINKLKTSPLRAAYTQIVDSLEDVSKEALKNALRVAVEEKARFYANRIAQTEIFRAKNYKNAALYLQDDEIEFVRYEMSLYHPKRDICDFYANLDIGYGKGVVPKEQMRTLPLHPFCRCKYVPVYLTSYQKEKFKKIKPKSFKEAQKETMAKFSKKQRREIVGSFEKLAEFEGGEDIEKIFNRLRPKYPIKKYVDIFEKKLYNEVMRKYERAILNRFENFDVSSKEKAVESFKKIWINDKIYKKHIAKRLKDSHIKDDLDYVKKTLNCLANTKECKIAIYEKTDIWNRIRYFDDEEWIVIFAENGTLLTSHKKEIREQDFEKKHKELGAKIKKGNINDEFREFFKRLRAKFGIF